MKTIMRFVIPDLTAPNDHPRAVRRAVGHRAAEVRQARREHNERIRPLLSPEMKRLQETTLHDALIRSVRIDPAQRALQLCLLGDDKDGFFDLRLEYKDIELTLQEISLLCLLAHADAEVYRDEIDLASAGTEDEGSASPAFIHRLSWHTWIETSREVTGLNALGEEVWRVFSLCPEIELRFGSLEMEIVRRADRQLSRSTDFITIVHDSSKIEGME